jgi:flavin-binding protein dodecin
LNGGWVRLTDVLYKYHFQIRGERLMSAAEEPTYRLSEIVGTSSESIHQAVRNGIRRASRTIRNVDWFEVTQVRGTVIDGEVGQFQVAMKVGFRVEE